MENTSNTNAGVGQTQKPIILTKEQESVLAVPYWQAVAWKESLDKGFAPFLPNKDGVVNAQPIYNLKSGYCLSGNDLVLAQIAKAKNDYKSNTVATYNMINDAKSFVKQGEHGINVNFKDQQGDYHMVTYFFPEQTGHPNRVDLGRANSRAIQPSNDIIDAKSAEPTQYMAAYLTACKTGAKFVVSPEVAEAFKQNITPIVENMAQKKVDRNPSIPKLNDVMFEASKLSLEAIKGMENRQGVGKAAEQKKEVAHKRNVGFEY